MTEAQIAVAQEWIDSGFRVPNCAERVALRAIVAAVTRPTPTSEQTELVARLTNFLPRNVCLTNRNVSDDTIVPLECSMGELRALADLIEALSSTSNSRDEWQAASAPKDAPKDMVARLRLCGVRLGGESQDEAAMRRNATIAQAADELVNAYRIIGEMREALEQVRDLEPREFHGIPDDWDEQIEACEVCQSYKGHPIQQGICDTHRQPLYRRRSFDEHERAAIGYRAKLIAREALAALNPSREQS